MCATSRVTTSLPNDKTVDHAVRGRIDPVIYLRQVTWAMGKRMNHLNLRLCCGLLCLLSAGVAHAQARQMPWESSPPPRLIEDRLRLEVGIWNASINTFLRADETVQQTGSELDGESDVGLADSRVMPEFELTLLPGKRQLFRLNGFSSHRNGSAVLTRQIEFDDSTYRVGDLVRSTFNLDMVGLGYAYRLFNKPRFELNVGADIQIASAEVNVYVPRLSAREADSGILPIPMLDTEMRWEVLPKWQLQARYRWLGGSGDDASADLSDWRVGVQWQFSQHVGLGLHYRQFGLHVDSTSNSHPGALRLDYKGAQLAIRASL